MAGETGTKSRGQKPGDVCFAIHINPYSAPKVHDQGPALEQIFTGVYLGLVKGGHSQGKDSPQLVEMLGGEVPHVEIDRPPPFQDLF